MNLRFAAAFSLAALVLSSCEPPKSNNPLTDPKTAVADPKLGGVWTGRIGTEHSEVTLTILPTEGAKFDAVLVGNDGKKGAVVLTFEGFPSVVAGKKYWNLRAKSFEGDYGENPKVANGYIFVRYELGKDGGLSLWQMDDGPAEAAVKAGTLEGVLSDKAPMQLTAPSEKLAAFVASPAGEKSFSLFGVFKKAKLEYPKAVAKPAP